MNKLFKKVNNKLNWVVEGITWFFLKSFVIKTNIICKKEFTIGITTFMNRFENCLKPLLKKISVLFPKCQIIVIANGHVKHNEQIKYLNKINKFCDRFANVKLISYHEPKGLSHLWNQIIKNSKYDKILILNDDLKIKMKFTQFVEYKGILKQNIATINSSWSNFFITTEIVDKIGWFDEGLLEIGGEDDDYSARLALKNIPIYNFKTFTIAGKLKLKNKRLLVNSYGKDMNEECYGYSSYNNHYLDEKWLMSNELFDGAVEVPNRLIRYWKLRHDRQ